MFFINTAMRLKQQEILKITLFLFGIMLFNLFRAALYELIFCITLRFAVPLTMHDPPLPVSVPALKILSVMSYCLQILMQAK